MPNEVELKFDIDPEGAARVREAGALAAVPLEAREHDTLYFDTPDGALRGAGYSLRVRKSGERCVQTIKRKNGGSVGLFVRKEWESEVADFDIDRGALKATALKRLLAKRDTKALSPIVRTRFCRTRWIIERGATRIEVALDEGRVSSGDREAPICELEMELIEGKPGTLFRLAEEIGLGVPLRLGVLSKGDRGHALATGHLGLPAKAEKLKLSPRLDLGESFRAVANACLRHFRLNEIALLAGHDGEALHQARVALRRLRTALSLFRPVVEGKAYQSLRRELRWFAGQFGEARNLDVLVSARGDAASRDLLVRRDAAHAHVRAVLRSDRVRALMLRLVVWIEGGSWRYRPRAKGPVLPFAEAKLDRLWGKVERRGLRLAALDAEERHRLRIDVKKLRYSAEFLAGIHSAKPLFRRRDGFLNALRAIQDRLGELNDRRLDPATGAPMGDPQRDGLDEKLLKAAEQAFARASAAARYWRIGATARGDNP